MVRKNGTATAMASTERSSGRSARRIRRTSHTITPMNSTAPVRSDATACRSLDALAKGSR